MLVWGGQTFVDFEQGLNFCVKQIRAALGDVADNPRFIETVPRRGYRFIAPVEWVPASLPDAAPEPTATPEPPAHRGWTAGQRALATAATLVILAAGALALDWFRNERTTGPPTKVMIAVLPFDNLSGDPAQTYFSDGFTDELIARLSRTNPTRLGVIARTSTMSYRETEKNAAAIGRELGVQHLVEGTVRRSGDRVRITAQLIRVSDQSHVWAEIYEGEVRDILQLQREVGNAIAVRILSTLGAAGADAAARRTVDPEVYDLYLRGRAEWNTRRDPEVVRATGSFKEAIRRDPTFAPAWAGLAETLQVHARPAALEAAEKAIALDDRLAEAHVAKAQILKHMLRWNWADEEFQRAIALDPSYAPARYFYAEFLAARGRKAPAVEQARQALVLDPKSAIAAHVAGVVHYYCGEYDAALRFLRKALEIDPAHSWSHLRIALVLERRRAFDEAFVEFARTAAPLRSAYAYAVSGRTAEARRILQAAMAAPDVEYQAYHLASAYAGLGEYDQALSLLERAVDRQLHDAIYINVDPRFEALRGLPRYRELLRRGGWD
jgi:TolB-like protein/Tfp pilus assembly protein PilF